MLFLASTITGCVSISTFASLVAIAIGITISAVGITISGITAGIKIVLLGKDKLNATVVLMSKALIDSYITDDEFVSVNNVLREYNEIKNKLKNPETSAEYIV